MNRMDTGTCKVKAIGFPLASADLEKTLYTAREEADVMHLISEHECTQPPGFHSAVV